MLRRGVGHAAVAEGGPLVTSSAADVNSITFDQGESLYLTHVIEQNRPIAGAFKRGVRGVAARWVRVALATAVSVLGVGALAGPAAATSNGHATRYQFRTLDNKNDLTFNQLLGINKYGVIAGYFDSGAQGHPNKGYLLYPPYRQRNYVNENFPGSVQTQVTGLNNKGVTVGFWSDMNNANQVNDNFGFYAIRGRHFHTVNFPTTNNSTPPVNQLLGVNDSDIAVGFYNDANGNSHGYTYSIAKNRFHEITISGATSVTAAAINNRQDIAGFETNAAGLVEGFLLSGHGKLTTLAFPGASMTQALGVNNADEVVGVYQLGSGSTATMHGFTWTRKRGFQTVDDPNGVGTTTVNGVNDKGQLVGFYVDTAGNTDGMLATPRH